MSKKLLNLMSKMYLLFFIYSIVGWIYEILYETIVHRWKFMPREFLRLPICPIYGIGGIILFIVFYKIISNNKINFFLKSIIVFIGTVVISSCLEYIASYVFELTTGGWPWQGYSDYFMNFNGRISLPTSLRFGVLGFLMLVVLHKWINMLLEFLESKKILNNVALILLIIFIIDIICGIAFPTNIKLNVVRECF